MALSEPIRDKNYFTLETFFIGGFSLITCFAFWSFMDKSASLYTIGTSAAALAFLVNHPHFLSSYVLLYWDNRSELLKKPKYLWAAVVAPFILLSLLVGSVMSKDPVLMGHIITAMFFFVGWHYVKQIFGCVIVSSVRRNIFYSANERRMILLSLYSIWFFNWAQSHVGNTTFDFYGILHYSLGLPEIARTVGFWCVGVSVLGVVLLHLRKYLDQGVIPAPPAVVAYAALLAWYLPMFAHPGYAYMIPFFHSLQYLAFVWLYKKNETAALNVGKPVMDQRRNWIIQFVGFLFVATFLGSMAFEWIPKYLDHHSAIDIDGFGTAPWLAAFILFINIHHYFIDNVIWRSDNAMVKKYLFAKPTAEDLSKDWAKSA